MLISSASWGFTINTNDVYSQAFISFTRAMPPTPHGGLGTPPTSCGHTMPTCISLSKCAQCRSIHMYVWVSICFFVRNHIYAARCYSYHAVFDFSLHRYVYSSCCVYTYHVVQLCKKTPGRYEYVYVSYTQHATCTQTPRGKPIAFIYIVVYVYTFEYPGFCYYNNIVV